MEQFYVKATIQDDTIGATSTPPAVQYNTLCLVDTPTGPTEVRYVSGFSEFASLYLNSSSVNIGDNDTIKHVAKLLQITPLYIKRVVKQEMLQGISCIGEPLLFDTKYKIKDKYYSLEIEEWTDQNKYYWIGLDGVLYYSGELPYASLSTTLLQALIDGGTLNEDDLAVAEEMFALRSLYPTLVQVYSQKSISSLLTNIYKYIPYESSNPIFEVTKNSISTRNPVEFSTNVVGESKDVLKDQYTCIVARQGESVPEGSFIKVGQNNYYLSTSGAFSPSRYSNPVPVPVPVISDSASASLFLLRALPSIESNSTTMVPMPKVYMDGGLRIGDDVSLNVASYFDTYSAQDVVLDTKTGKYYVSLIDDNDWVDQPLPQALIGDSFSSGQVIEYTVGDISTHYKCIAAGTAVWNGVTETGVWEQYTYVPNSWQQTNIPNDTAGSWSLSSGDLKDVMEVSGDKNSLIRIKNNEKSVNNVCITFKLFSPSGDESKDLDMQFCVGLGAPYNVNKDKVIMSQSSMRPLEILSYIVEYAMSLGFSASIDGDIHAYFKRNLSLGVGGSVVGFDYSNKLDLIKDSSKETYVYSIPSDESMVSNFAIENFYIRIADNIFYQGENPPAIPTTSSTVFVQVGEGEVSYATFKDNFYNALKSYYNTNLYQDKYAFFEDLGDNLEIQFYPDAKETSKLSLLYMPVIQKTQAKFAVVQKFISSSDSFIWSFTNTERSDNKEELLLTMVYRTYEEDYEISFDESVIDGYGKSLYYDYVDNDFMEIVKLTGDTMPEGNQLSAVDFGSAVKYSTPDVNDFVAAIQSIPDEEISAKFSNIWDCGYCHPTYAKAIINVIKGGIHAMYPMSIPIDYLEEDDVASYAESIGSDLDYRHVRVVFGPTRDGTVGNFSTKLNGSYKVLENYYFLFRTVAMEFAGQMGKTNSPMSGNFIKIFDKATAGRLLDKYRIACVVGNSGDGYYINDNTTGQLIKSDLREEQNVRVLNAINNYLEVSLLQYVGQQNTPILRDTISTTVLQDLTDLVITNKLVKPTALWVKCDDENNTATSVMKNMLHIDVYVKLINVIKHIEVISHAVPLNG